MLEISIKISGELRVLRDHQPIELPKSRKARALLVYLTCNPGPQPRAHLCDLLFGDTADPRASLRWNVNRLRKAVGDLALLEGDNEGLALGSQVSSDLAELLAYLSGVESFEVESRWKTGQQFEHSLGNGGLAAPVLSDAASYEAWRLTATHFVSRQHAELIRLLTEHAPDYQRAELCAERWVNLEAGNESAWAALVRAQTRLGKLKEAQQTTDLGRQRLRSEGTPLSGELDQASDPVSGNTETALLRTGMAQQNNRHRVRLGIMPCQVRPVEEELSLVVTESLFAAAVANRTCAVLARSSWQRLANLPMDERTRLAEIVLESTIKQSGDHYKLSMELISTRDETSIFRWIESFDATDRVSLADQIEAFFSARFEIDLQMALILLAHTKPQDQLNLWDRYFLALPRIYSPQGHDPVESLGLLQAVIDEEPSFGPAVSVAAWVRTTHPTFNQSSSDIAVTASMARRAIELCQDDAFFLSLAALVIATCERDLNTAMDVVDRALMFNPHSTLALSAKGILRHYQGDQTAAIELLQRAHDAIDTEPVTFMILAFLSLAHYCKGDFVAGLELAHRACGRNPSFVACRRALALCLAASGQEPDARRAVEDLMELDPSEHADYYRQYSPYQDRELIERICQELTLVGLKESAVEG